MTMISAKVNNLLMFGLCISLCLVKDDKTWYLYDYTVTGESYAICITECVWRLYYKIYNLKAIYGI